jgi:hypothetical protein
MTWCAATAVSVTFFVDADEELVLAHTGETNQWRACFTPNTAFQGQH